MTTDKDSFVEVTATDAKGIARQQEVIDAFKFTAKGMNAIDEACAYAEAVLDARGAPRFDQEYIRKALRDKIRAEEAKRQAKRYGESE